MYKEKSSKIAKIALRERYRLYMTKYSGTEIICEKENRSYYDSSLLGSLVKSSAATGISPQPKSPYTGIIFKTLIEQIQEMKVLDQCVNGSGYHRTTYGHGIKDSIIATMRCLEDVMCGLKLESLLPKDTSTMRSQWELS
jgi:hypothetical protein